MGGGEEEPSPRVKFRHVNTGRYLYLKNSHMHKAMSKMMASKVLSGLGALGKKLRRDNVTPVAPNSSFKPSSTKRHNRSSVRVISSVQDGSAFATRYSLVYHRSGVSANAARQVLELNPIGPREHDSALNGVLELAYIARPLVLHHQSHRRVRDTFLFTLGI